MIINENKMLQMLDGAQKILLIEPNYRKKYPPLGLAKIKTYLKEKDKKVKFAQTILPEQYDLICITTLFTYYSQSVLDVVKHKGFFNENTPILLGGILASMMPEVFDDQKNTFVFRGYSKELDQHFPDKTIMNDIEDPWNTFSYIFTSRGCPNKCAYCTVWRIEKERWVNSKWREQIDLSKPNIMISDNNLSAVTFDHLKEIINFAVSNKKKILFDNGFDCKHITKKMSHELSKLKFIRNGMRMAFDRIEEDGIFQKAVNMLQDAGVSKNSMMAYVLFNFTDHPQDAYYRARTCVNLGVRPYPQYYRPLNTLNKKTIWVGKHWTLQLGRAFRHYWLMRGIYAKMTFEEYINSKEGINQHRLTKEDIKTYNRR